MRINTKKYKALKIKNEGEPSMFMVTTARKSSVEAKNLCSSCGLWFSRHEMRTCKTCGSEVCKYCLKEKQEEQCCLDKNEN